MDKNIAISVICIVLIPAMRLQQHKNTDQTP